MADELTNLFAGELNPVAPKAQRKVPVPAGYVYTYDLHKGRVRGEDEW